MKSLLLCEGIEAGYDRLQVLWGINIEVKEGEIVCILGPNGAGKTTTLKVITGLLKPYKGKIYFNGQDITNLPPYMISRLGVSFVPETKELFPYMSVYENLLLGLEKTGKIRHNKNKIDYVMELFPRLKNKEKQLAKTLSGGEQQMLALARALISEPRLLILDEPSTGLAPNLVGNIFEALGKLKNKGLTILLVEQNVSLAMEIADRGYIMENGKIVLEGRKDELLNNEIVKNAYLGY